MGEPLPADQRRASHEDRDRVAERLREAAGDGRLSIEELEQRLEATFAARTYADLESLTHDLPDDRRPRLPVPPPAAAASVPARVTGRAGAGWSLAVMCGCVRRGRWALSERHRAVAVMGGVELDLRDAELESGRTDIVAFSLMGGIDIVVPDDCTMRVSGFGLMGGFDHTDKGAPAPDAAPVVTVRGMAVMGGVSVVRRAGRAASDRSGGHEERR